MLYALNRHTPPQLHVDRGVKLRPCLIGNWIQEIAVIVVINAALEALRDVNKAELSDKLLMFSLRENFGETVGGHLVCRDLFDNESLSLCFLSDPHLMDIDVSNLGVKSI